MIRPPGSRVRPGEILQVNGVTGEVLARLKLSGVGDDVQVAQSGANAFALNRSKGEVAFVDGRLQAVGGTRAVPGVDRAASCPTTGKFARLITVARGRIRSTQ